MNDNGKLVEDRCRRRNRPRFVVGIASFSFPGGGEMNRPNSCFVGKCEDSEAFREFGHCWTPGLRILNFDGRVYVGIHREKIISISRLHFWCVFFTECFLTCKDFGPRANFLRVSSPDAPLYSTTSVPYILLKLIVYLCWSSEIQGDFFSSCRNAETHVVSKSPAKHRLVYSFLLCLDWVHCQ